MDQRVREFRAAVEAHRKSKQFRYPEELKREAAELVPLLRKEGSSRSAVEKLLDVNWQTLARWVGASRGTERKKQAKPKPVPVVLAGSSASSSPVLVTPNGVRVEGLSVDDITTVLRGLV